MARKNVQERCSVGELDHHVTQVKILYYTVIHKYFNYIVLLYKETAAQFDYRDFHFPF